jgi:hypothetical protein
MCSIGVIALLCCWGCGGGDAYREVTEEDAHQAEQHADEHHHHAHDAPHGGHLIELGDHEYSAEVVHDGDTGQLIVYVFDAHAENTVPVSLEQIEFAVEGGQTIVLRADPQEGDPQGKASRFLATGDAVAAIGDIEDLHGSVKFEINGKPYSGELSHDHDHADHEH